MSALIVRVVAARQWWYCLINLSLLMVAAASSACCFCSCSCSCPLPLFAKQRHFAVSGCGGGVVAIVSAAGVVACRHCHVYSWCLIFVRIRLSN